MKRKIVSILLAGALLASVGLAACGKEPVAANGDNMFTPSGNEVQKQSVTLKIASYNIKNCDKGNAIDKIARDIVDQNLDLVAVQEVDQNTKRANGKDVLKELAGLSLPNYHFYKTIKLEGGSYGIGILSRYPLEDCEQVSLKTAKGAEDRVLAQAAVTVNGIRLNVFNTHLSFEDRELRQEQIKFIQEKLKDAEPYVLMGDFNVLGYEEYEGFSGASALNNQSTNFMTYIGDDEGFRGLDNIIYSRDIKMENPQMVPTSASDHNMLVGTFTVSKK